MIKRERNMNKLLREIYSNSDLLILRNKFQLRMFHGIYLLIIVALTSGCATGLVNERVEHLKDDSVSGTESKCFQSLLDKRNTLIKYKGKMFLGSWGKPDGHTFIGKSEIAGIVTYLRFGTGGNGTGEDWFLTDNKEFYDNALRYKNLDSGQDLEVGVILSSRDDHYFLLDINKGGTVKIIYNSTLDKSNRLIRACYVYRGELYLSKMDVQFSPQFVNRVRIALLQSMYLVTVPLDITVLPLQPLLCYITLMGRMGDGSH